MDWKERAKTYIDMLRHGDSETGSLAIGCIKEDTEFLNNVKKVLKDSSKFHIINGQSVRYSTFMQNINDYNSLSSEISKFFAQMSVACFLSYFIDEFA